MASNEDIEARLCAYIEGDLDAAQRQEIERHLAAHPPHQKMIQDLVLTRNLLTRLPRAPSPPDLGEGLQGQLERAMLLGDDPGEHAAWRTHARRMPRLAVLGAVLIAAAALTGSVVQLLRLASHPAQIATIPMSPPIVLSAPATQPAVTQAAATQPVAPAIAVADASTTQPAAPSVQLAGFTLAPATQPSADQQPDGDDVQPALEDWPDSPEP